MTVEVFIASLSGQDNKVVAGGTSYFIIFTIWKIIVILAIFAIYAYDLYTCVWWPITTFI